MALCLVRDYWERPGREAFRGCVGTHLIVVAYKVGGFSLMLAARVANRFTATVMLGLSLGVGVASVASDRRKAPDVPHAVAICARACYVQ